MCMKHEQAFCWGRMLMISPKIWRSPQMTTRHTYFNSCTIDERLSRLKGSSS